MLDASSNFYIVQEMRKGKELDSFWGKILPRDWWKVWSALTDNWVGEERGIQEFY